MDEKICASLNALISSLEFLPINSSVAYNWIITNIPIECANDVFLCIKSQLFTITDPKHIINVINFIIQLATNKNYADVIMQHSFHILVHFLNLNYNPEFNKEIVATGNSWVIAGLVNQQHFESILDSSKCLDCEDNLTAGGIADLVNNFKKSGKWTQYLPIDFQFSDHIKSAYNKQQINNLVDKCLEEISQI